MMWPKKPIPRVTNGQTWIHPIVAEINSRRNYSAIWYNGDRTQWIHLCRDKERHVWPTTGPDNSNWHPYKQPRTTCIPSMQTNGRPVIFWLVVDDFWVKYIGKLNAYHLIESIRKKYPVDVDCTSGLHCVIKLDWKYEQKQSVDLSMPKYVPNNLNEFQHPYPKRPQHA